MYVDIVISNAFNLNKKKSGILASSHSSAASFDLSIGDQGGGGPLPLSRIFVAYKCSTVG